MADNSNTLQLTLQIKDDGTIVIDKAVGKIGDLGNKTEEFSKKAGGHLDFIKSKWVEISAAAVGFGLAVNKAFQWADLGAKAMQVKESYKILTQTMGIAGDKLIEKMKEVSFVCVDTSDLMLKAQKGLVQGLSEQQIIKIMEASRVAARYMGIDVESAFERTMDAITNLQTRGLKGAFTIDVQQAVEDYAKKVGKTADQVSEFGKIQAIANAVIEESDRKLKFLGGTLDPTVSEKIQRAKSGLNEFRETVGKGFVATVSTAAGSLYGLGAASMAVYMSGTKFVELVLRGAREVEKLGGITGTGTEEKIRELQVFAKAAEETMFALAEQGKEQLIGAKEMLWGIEKEPIIGKDKFNLPSTFIDGVKKLYDETLKFIENYEKEVKEASESMIASVRDRIVSEKQAYDEALKLIQAYDEDVRESSESMIAEAKRRSDEEKAIYKSTYDEALKLIQTYDEDVRESSESMIAEAKRRADEEKRINNESAMFGKTLAQNFASAWNFNLKNIITDSQNMGDAVRKVFFGMADAFSSAVSKMISDWMLFGSQYALTGKIEKGAGIIGLLGGGLGSLFGGAAAAPAVLSPASFVAPIGWQHGGWITEPIYGIGKSGTRYSLGEKEAELITPKSKVGGGDTYTYYIDARGAQRGVSAEIMRAIRESENRAVKRSVNTVADYKVRGGKFARIFEK